jgi:hypothetical protein
MDYDWLWVILAVGVLAPVGFVPVALASLCVVARIPPRAA